LSCHCFENLTVLHATQSLIVLTGEEVFFTGNVIFTGETSLLAKLPLPGKNIYWGNDLYRRCVLTGEVWRLSEIDGRTDLSCENSSHFVCCGLLCDITVLDSCISQSISLEYRNDTNRISMNVM
jgi:hypothetical protein